MRRFGPDSFLSVKLFLNETMRVQFLRSSTMIRSIDASVTTGRVYSVEEKPEVPR